VCNFSTYRGTVVAASFLFLRNTICELRFSFWLLDPLLVSLLISVLFSFVFCFLRSTNSFDLKKNVSSDQCTHPFQPFHVRVSVPLRNKKISWSIVLTVLSIDPSFMAKYCLYYFLNWRRNSTKLNSTVKFNEKVIKYKRKEIQCGQVWKTTNKKSGDPENLHQNKQTSIPSGTLKPAQTTVVRSRINKSDSTGNGSHWRYKLHWRELKNQARKSVRKMIDNSIFLR